MNLVVRASFGVAGVLGLVFGLPMLFAPGPWAEFWGWQTQELITGHVVGGLLVALGIGALLGLARPQRAGALAATIAVSGLAGFGALVYGVTAMGGADNMWFLAFLWLLVGLWFGYLMIRSEELRPL